MEGKDTTVIFFELIQIAIGTREADTFTHTLSNDEWQQIYDISVKQTVAGIVFLGINKLPQEKRPHKQLYMQWFLLCESIKNKNRILSKAAEKISQKFAEIGFENTILKGQGVAELYPEPQYRIPGDIDIWLKGSRKEIYRYVKSVTPDCTPFYHHVDFNVIKDIEIEVHFTPSWMFNYFTNRTLQKYFEEQQEQQMHNTRTTANGICLHAPDNNFNRIFILVHIYRHLFSEGIGLRQILDYHMVLAQGFTPQERDNTMHILESLNMDGFAAACMHVLKKVFATKEEFLIAEPDAIEGEFLLNEIMIAGNFGKFDHRQDIGPNDKPIKGFFRKLRQCFRFFRYHTGEILFAPLFKIWHNIWRFVYFR